MAQAAGPWGWGPGWGWGEVEGFLVAQHWAKYGSLPTPLEGPGSASPDTEVKAKEQLEALVLRLDESEFSRPGPSPPPPPFGSLWRTPTWNCVCTCACFHLRFQHKSKAPQVERRVCVCGAGLGLRGSGKGDESTHRGSHPQPARRVQVQALGEESRNLVPPPRTYPPACRWDPVRWKKKGDGEGGRQRAEMDRGDHRGRHRSKASPRTSGSKGAEGSEAGERRRREREARPGEEQAGISLPGRRWSILQ